MRASLSDAKLLALVGEIMGVLDLEEFRRTLLQAVLAAVPAKIASLNDVGPDHLAVVSEPRLDPEWYEKFAGLLDENPLYRHYVATGDGTARRFSDVTTREQLESTRLFREFYAPLGIRHQIAFTLPAGTGRLLAVALSRGQTDFSDAERDFLDRARPYLIQAYRNAIAFSTGNESPRQLRAALLAAGLTPRESEVVRLVALGRSNPDIAAALGLSDRTVAKHAENAFRKLGVRGRSQAAALAWELAAGVSFHGDAGPLRRG